MDSMISLGQKNTLAKYMILSGADNRPPMLDKDLWTPPILETLSSSYNNPQLHQTVSPSLEVDRIACLNKAMTFLTAVASSRFDNVVKIRTTPDARTEGEWGFEHTKAVFNKEIIPFLKSLKDIFNVFDKDLLNEIIEVQTVFDQMDATVQQSSVDKQCCPDCSRVKFLASKDEAPDFIIKFLKMIQVRLNATVRNIRTDNGTEFVNQTLRSYYESVDIYHETSVTRSPQQNGVVERRNRTLVEAAYIIKPDLSYLHVFGALCYPNNDSENLGKLQAKADIAEQFGLGLGLQLMTHATSSSGLVSNPIPQQPCNSSQRDDWDRLFQPMFDEYFNPLTIAVSPVLVANAPRAVDLADSPVSTLIDQDAPSISIPSTHDQEHSPIMSQGFEESPKTPHFHNDPLHESFHEDSTSQGSSSNMRPTHT
ncbi:retrovirus-related pol polyprotein from transposon TNT 1-94 [Tanacetum coccineum]